MSFLQDPEKVDEIMSSHSSCGIFKMDRNSNPWIYGGAYFWFKHSDIFVDNWQEIDQIRHGVEHYLGEKTDISSGFSLFGGDRAGNPYTYSEDRWTEHLKSHGLSYDKVSKGIFE